jgi:predicted nucleic acid-binding protein
MIAIDANVFIYALEGNAEFGYDARMLLDSIANGITVGHASELVYLEVLTGAGNGKNARKLLEGIGIVYHPVTLEVLLRAVTLRQEYKLHSPDAIHIASALQVGCTHFITNDHQVLGKRVLGIEIVSLADAHKCFV